MEKLDRESVWGNTSKDVLDKLDEIVNWINSREKEKHLAVLTEAVNDTTDPLLTTALKELGLTLDQVRLEITDDQTHIYKK